MSCRRHCGYGHATAGQGRDLVSRAVSVPSSASGRSGDSIPTRGVSSKVALKPGLCAGAVSAALLSLPPLLRRDRDLRETSSWAGESGQLPVSSRTFSGPERRCQHPLGRLRQRGIYRLKSGRPWGSAAPACSVPVLTGAQGYELCLETQLCLLVCVQFLPLEAQAGLICLLFCW